ncbi:MAG: carbamoyltransferase HypF [bacterium]|jgi:hydrogenase maturation protein HypF
MDSAARRLRLHITGTVQGVGFRPFLYRLAHELGLKGWVNNSPQGVILEAEGSQEQLECLLERLPREKPVHASFQSIQQESLPPVGYQTFDIKASELSGRKSTLVLPDLATCPQCRDELFDPHNRRYLYPFTNCTLCGPRFSIIHDLPYDRVNTTMSMFPMCPACQQEYENPLDRRFHAQPNACPLCGPHLELWDGTGTVLEMHHTALLQTVQLLRQGHIVAVKGLGGFHLMVDAANPEAIRQLRQRKHREEKPFALFYPTLKLIRQHYELSALEQELLTSPAAPIVLLRWRPEASAAHFARHIAPGNPYLGVMLPYTPLHHLLLHELNSPVVATSGNLTDEPICIDEYEALQRLAGIADFFLVHNRPIIRHVDDSVVREVHGQPMMIRRARGYAPLPVHVRQNLPCSLAVGGHLKNTIALSNGNNIFLSQHIGDLETLESQRAFEEVIGSIGRMYELRPLQVACDLHPDYVSTHYARRLQLPLIQVQHHHAHVVSCMAEHGLLGEQVLGVSWDGTGFGPDGTIWGGEFLISTRFEFTRFAHFRTFPLPTGDQAVKEPRRTALGLLYEAFAEEAFQMTELAPVQAFSSAELKNFQILLQRNLNCPRTSSAGRLFDAIAALLNIRQKVSFEGQAAMELEFLLQKSDQSDHLYPIAIERADAESPYIIDWKPLLQAILADLNNHAEISLIAHRFHRTLAEIIVKMAILHGERIMILSGGCFQNKFLTEMSIHRLQQEGFVPFWQRQIPCNDGGISLGQLMASAKEKAACV